MSRNAFACAACAVGLLWHAAGQAKPLVLHGRFTIAYAPIACVMAPCPPGAFLISKDDRVVGSVQRIEVTEGTPDAARRIIETASQQRGPIVIEGEARFLPERSAFVVRARSAQAAGHYP
jgi:hypothetical protein